MYFLFLNVCRLFVDFSRFFRQFYREVVIKTLADFLPRPSFSTLLTTPGWKMPTLNAFIESLTCEHDKLIQMGIIRSSRDQSLHVLRPKDLKGKGKQEKNPKTRFEAPKLKVEN